MIDIDWILTAKPGSPTPEHVLQILRSAFWDHIHHGTLMDEGLGFKGKNLSYKWRMHWRNSHLRYAAQMIEASSPSARAGKLADEIKRFETTVWPRCQHIEQPPERLTPLQCQLFHAAKTRLKLPDYRQLISIL